MTRGGSIFSYGEKRNLGFGNQGSEVQIVNNKRPLSVTLIGWLFVGAGAFGLAYHLTEFKALQPFPYDVLWVCVVRVVAIVCGVFMLRGRNWARWLALTWTAYHVILSSFHSFHQSLAHGLLLAVFAYFLCRQQASDYFRNRKTEAT